MRVLMLPKYDATGASSRLRTFQYVEPLKAFGIEADVYPLLGDGYVTDLYSQRISPLKVVKSYVRRIKRMLRADDYDVIWVEKELLPWMPVWLEKISLARGPAIMVDFDDALFHRYDQHRSRLVRMAFGRKIDTVMADSDLVTAGNEYLSTRAAVAGARRIEWLPTVVDFDRYPAPTMRESSTETVVGWIGSPSTAHYLQQITPALLALKKRHSFRCVAIGARADQVSGTPFAAVAWREEAEAEMLSGIDIGVMPLVDGEWERGKCGYKLIQYMAAGRPVVASPVGVNSSIVQDGGNGYLAQTTEDWITALDRLLTEPGLRTAMGLEGRRQVEATYSLQVQAARVAALLYSLRRPAEGSPA